MSEWRIGDWVRYRWKGLFGDKYEAKCLVVAVDEKGRPGTLTVGAVRYLNYHGPKDDLTLIARPVVPAQDGEAKPLTEDDLRAYGKRADKDVLENYLDTEFRERRLETAEEREEARQL